ncbi:hypothetical protein [Prosthecodimorpha staleyi]|uniref:Sulfotransferase domain-containing protein n=1 Tax=Prosthecodimorpha staleyi TaxID=2840188 RepID=A0A947CZR0_9HYPH|nr:hypothetical protein [Prosthecodimorpha staleyi]MBT9288100.1 hypothetical protein [Prosthecodimorpha staleyi]
MYNKIYLHVGMPKTGSTYLQNALDLLSHQSVMIHTSYPVLDQNEDFGRIQSGNGQFVAAQLSVNNVSDVAAETVSQRLRDILDAADNSKPNLLISSELFSWAPPQRMACLLEILGSHARSVEILVFVRPFERLCRASYHQKVKRRSYSGEYDETFFEIFSKQLVAQLSVIGGIPNIVHVLDYRQSGLLGALLSALGEDPRLAEAIPEQVVNRSLTGPELQILRGVNSVFRDDGLATRISNRWIRSNPDAASDEDSVDRARVLDVFRRVLAENAGRLESPTCQEMLRRLISNVGNPAVDDTVAGPRPAGNTVEAACVESAELLRMALEEIAKSVNPDQSIDRYTRSLTPTRETFDPVHYLLLNRDVLAAGIDPVQHYRRSGHLEGRFTAFEAVSAQFDEN